MTGPGPDAGWTTHCTFLYLHSLSSEQLLSSPAPCPPSPGTQRQTVKTNTWWGAPSSGLCRPDTQTHDTDTRQDTPDTWRQGDTQLGQTPAGSPAPHTALMTSCLNSILKWPSFSCLYLRAGSEWTLCDCLCVCSSLDWLSRDTESLTEPALLCSPHPGPAWTPGHSGWSPAHLSLTARPETGTGGPSPARCLTHRTLHITLCH